MAEKYSRSLVENTQDKEENEKRAAPRKLNFKIDETLEDVVPFSDIKDTKKFAKELREAHWQ
jgi:hypothetical protein